jgi:hypothetical protein
MPSSKSSNNDSVVHSSFIWLLLAVVLVGTVAVVVLFFIPRLELNSQLKKEWEDWKSQCVTDGGTFVDNHKGDPYNLCFDKTGRLASTWNGDHVVSAQQKR